MNGADLFLIACAWVVLMAGVARVDHWLRARRVWKARYGGTRNPSTHW